MHYLHDTTFENQQHGKFRYYIHTSTKIRGKFTFRSLSDMPTYKQTIYNVHSSTKKTANAFTTIVILHQHSYVCGTNAPQGVLSKGIYDSLYQRMILSHSVLHFYLAFIIGAYQINDKGSSISIHGTYV